MKLFGSLRELVAAVFRSDSQEITLRPNQSTTYTAARDVQLPPGDTDHSLVSASSTQVLTNKTLDGDDNTVQDLALTSLKTVLGDAGKILARDVSGIVTSANTVPNSDPVVTTTATQTLTGKTLDGDDNTIQDLPETAIKTNLTNASKFFTRDASGVPESATKAVPAGAVVGTSDTQVLTNKTLDGDDNTIQDIALTSLKTVLGDANKAIVRDGAGAVISGNTVPNSSTLLTTDSTATVTGKTLDGNSNTLTVLAGTQLSGQTPIANGGTGQSSKTAAFDALSPTTTKGDIIVYDGTDNIRVPVGTDGQVLTADSGEASGLIWSSPTSTVDPTSLSDADATRLGLKAYFSTLSYNSGISPTLSLTSGGGTLNSVGRAYFIPYQMQDGTWRLKFSAFVTLSSATRTLAVLAVNGVTSYNLTNYRQPISAWTAASLTVTSAHANANSSDILIVNHTSGTTSLYHFAGDIELASKPTWAY
jgi:hypothetical protein